MFADDAKEAADNSERSDSFGLPEELSERDEEASSKPRIPSPPLFYLSVEELASRRVAREPVSVRVFGGLSVCEPIPTPRLHSPPINLQRSECEENVWLLGSSFDWLLDSLRVQVADVNLQLRLPAKESVTEQRERCQRFGAQNVRLYKHVVPYVDRLAARLRTQQRYLYRNAREASKTLLDVTHELSRLEDPAVTESKRHIVSALERLQMFQRILEHLEKERILAEDKSRLVNEATTNKHYSDQGPDKNMRRFSDDILQQRIHLRRMADTVECDDYANPDLYRMVNRCQMRRSDLLLYEAEKEVERLIHDKDGFLFNEDMPDFEDLQLGLQLQNWMFYSGLY